MNVYEFLLAVLDRVALWLAAAYHEFQEIFWLVGIVAFLGLLRLLQ